MKTKTYNVYKFAELSGPAREKAIARHAEALGKQWSGDCVIEDAKAMLEHAGFSGLDVSYSGFWSQGDGACFTGSWSAADVNAKAMHENAPKDQELHRIADGFAKLASEAPGATFTAKRNCHRHSHPYCVGFLFDREQSAEWEKQATELARDAMEWIYLQLETDYEWATAEEQVVESLEANNYDFTEDGKIE